MSREGGLGNTGLAGGRLVGRFGHGGIGEESEGGGGGGGNPHIDIQDDPTALFVQDENGLNIQQDP